MKLKITLLGTGTSQGIPVVACSCEICRSKDEKDKRLRPAAMVETPYENIVIDAGPDFRQQMLRENVKKVDALLITHNHKDHIGGLDDVRAFNWVLQKPMDIYGNGQSLKVIEKDFSYAFEIEKYPGVPQINLHLIHNTPFNINNTQVMPIAALHGKLPVFGYRLGDFSYLTDASFIEEKELEKMKGSKIVVINALRQKKHHSHFTLDEAVDILNYLQPQKGFITHISHQMGFHKSINNKLPKGISLAWDGLKVEI